MSDIVTNNNLPLQNIRDKRHGMNNEVASWDQIFDVRVSSINRSASSQTLNGSLLQPTVQPRNNQLATTVRRSPRRSMSQEILTDILDDSTRVSMPEPFVDVLDPRPKDTVDEHVRSRSGSEGLIGSLQKYVSWRLSVGIGSKGGNLPGTHHWYRYRLSRFSSRRVRKRVVFKHGDCNIVQGNVAKRRTRYLQDIFTTLVDAQWRWTLLVFVLNFLLSWLCFACVWYLIVTTHGDLRPENLNPNGRTIEWKPCVTNIDSFTSCFLFSVETQHTIGYGGRMTTEECPEAIAVMCLQSIAGVFIQAFMVGIVFAKLSRPKKRTQTLLFSRNAVICQRDGQPCLMFRVGDMRHKSHIIEAHVRAQLIQRKITREGEELPFYQQELKVGNDGEEDRLFFIWPTTIVHKIDRDSPLYKFSARDLLREHFEIVVLLEGVVESTGMTTQARSSYLPSEILWGHRFQSIVTFKKETSEYEVDYTLFNNTVEVETPLCSSKQLDAQRAALCNNSVDQSTSETYQIRRPSTHTLTTLSSADSLQLLNNYEEDSPCSTRNRQTASPLPKCTIAMPEDDDSVS